MKVEIDEEINKVANEMFEIYEDDIEYELVMKDETFVSELKKYQIQPQFYIDINKPIPICDIPSLDESIRKFHIKKYLSPMKIMDLGIRKSRNSLILKKLQDECKDIRIPITEKIRKIAAYKFKNNISMLLENYSCQSNNVACRMLK